MFKEAADVFLKIPAQIHYTLQLIFYTTVLYVSHKYAAAQQLSKVEVSRRLSQ